MRDTLPDDASKKQFDKKAKEAKVIEERRKKDIQDRDKWAQEVAERERNATRGVPDSVKEIIDKWRRS